MIRTVACSTIQIRMTAVLAGAADRRERLEVEAHARRCARCSTAYADLVAASVALDRAYAPLRATSTQISPARVRFVLRDRTDVPNGVRLGRLAARLTELAVAAAVTAFAFAGSASFAPAPAIVEETMVDPAPPAPAALLLTSESAAVLRWVRIGRYATTPDLVEPPMLPPSHGDDTTLTDPQGRGALR